MNQEFESETVGEQPFFSEAERADEFSRRRRRRRPRMGRRRRRPVPSHLFGGYGGYGGQSYPEPPDDSDSDEDPESELRGRVVPPRRYAPMNRASAFGSAGYRRPVVRRHLQGLRSRFGYRTGIRPGAMARYPYRSAGGPGIWRGRYPYGATGRPGVWTGRYPYRSSAGAGTWPRR